MPTPERTSHARIVTAARALLETGGPAAVTMQRVAHEVGVRAPSLYKRVRDRDALMTAVAEAVVDDLGARLTASDPSLPALARTFRVFAHEQPEGFRLIFGSVPPQEALQRASEPVLRAAADLVGEGDALDAARLVTAWATGFVHMELAGAFRLGGDVDRAFEFGLTRLVAAVGSPVSGGRS